MDKIGAPTNGESYLDIKEVELTFSDNLYVVRITVNALWLLKLDDPSIFLEWDLLVDVDPNYGWNDPIFLMKQVQTILYASVLLTANV